MAKRKPMTGEELRARLKKRKRGTLAEPKRKKPFTKKERARIKRSV